jgi:hypothetical protein
MLFSTNRNGLFDQYQEIKSRPPEGTFDQWEALKYVFFANRNGLFDQYQEIKSRPPEGTVDQWEALKYVVFCQ